MKTPFPNGSHFALHRKTLTMLGLECESTAMSPIPREIGSFVLVAKNSPHRMNPKKPKQHAAHRRHPVYGFLKLDKLCCIFTMIFAVIGSLFLVGVSAE